MAKNTQNARETMEQMHAERDQTGDVTFLVESQRIRAHRSILATQSPKYKAQFYGPHRDEGEIRVENVSAAAFEVFLQFFYKETVDLTMDNIEMVLDLVQQSLVDNFVEYCVNFLKDRIKANKFYVPYRLANLYDIESLRLACEQRISTNTMDIFASDDFLRCDRDTLLQILKMDSLNCNEHNVFAACISWARAQCKRDNLDDGKPENLRAALGDAIHQIRFSSFNSDEFAALHKSLEGFFKPDESIELLYITAKLKHSKLPKFSLAMRTQKIKPAETSKKQSAWQLECNRFLRIKGVTVIIDKSRRSNFSLSCDKSIRLHGFTLGMHLSKANLSTFSKILSVQVKHNFGSLVLFNLMCNVYQSPTRYNETMIIFEKPIEHVTFFSCSFQLPFELPNNEFTLHTYVEVSNIEFALGGKWVTRFFFDKYTT